MNVLFFHEQGFFVKSNYLYLSIEEYINNLQIVANKYESFAYIPFENELIDAYIQCIKEHSSHCDKFIVKFNCLSKENQKKLNNFLFLRALQKGRINNV